MNASPAFDRQKMEDSLTESERLLRECFVDEYIKDHDPYRACIRMGFLAVFAADQAKIFMQDGYVLRKLEYLRQQANNPSETDRAAMLENLRFLAHNGTPASRATATKLYMEAQGYIKKDDGGAEAQTDALIEALKDFSKNTHE